MLASSLFELCKLCSLELAPIYSKEKPSTCLHLLSLSLTHTHTSFAYHSLLTLSSPATLAMPPLASGVFTRQCHLLGICQKHGLVGPPWCLLGNRRPLLPAILPLPAIHLLSPCFVNCLLAPTSICTAMFVPRLALFPQHMCLVEVV